MSTPITPTSDDLTEGTAGRLIAAGKVSGTAVFGPDDVQIGRVEDVMIAKATGQVAYAVLEFGGFLGMGARHVAVPWQMLTYSRRLGGFVLPNLTLDRLEGAPAFDADAPDPWSGADRYWGPSPA